jgi:hypothetical protein
VQPGFEFDGIIGYDFLNQFVIEIDYLNKFMNLYNPRAYAYAGKEKAIPRLLAAEDVDGVIGGEIFRRLNMILDYRHRRMFLEPNKSLNDPYKLEIGG